MAVYSVFSNAAKSPDDVVFLKQGFSWPAFLFSVPWCLWHRLWIAAIIIAALVILFVSLFDGTMALILMLAMLLALGFCAGELRRGALLAKGFNEHMVVSASNREEAELRYFLAAAEDVSALSGVTSKPFPPNHHEPLGLFGTAR